jgi:hypothetical protein
MDTHATHYRRKSEIPGYWFDAVVISIGIVLAIVHVLQ